MIEFADSPDPAEIPGSGVPVVYGPGRLAELGRLAADLGATRVLVVTDPGIRSAGHVDRAVDVLTGAGLHAAVFDGVAENPTSEHVAAAAEVARSDGIDLLVGLGGGSSMDVAKGTNFVLTNGGTMADYWGKGKAARPMLPSIMIPTTAGTGSEAQSYALISDPATHRKMACGDEKARARVAILDPELTATVPREVATAVGLDAVSHAVESAGSTARNETSRRFSRAAWLRLERAFEQSLADPTDIAARADMLIGAHLAGAAIENSMLGAAHACANPLTARFDVVHGQAVAVCLPHVVRFNGGGGENPYADLSDDASELDDRLA